MRLDAGKAAYQFRAHQCFLLEHATPLNPEIGDLANFAPEIGKVIVDCVAIDV